ncbi:MAG TPA: hypothetical protein VL652_34820 [Kutzneria sp.]|jgi:hypothetical protein|nr:hypothetical protein [Kutzneria sp.]
MQDVTNERAEYIAGLRELADILEEHPELMLPYRGAHAPLEVIPGDADEQREQLAAWARVLPGKKQKAAAGASGELFRLTGNLRGLAFEVLCVRSDVCERVVTGTTEVTREVPDPQALAAVPKVTVTETVETVEWVCGSVLDQRPAEVTP